MNIHKYNDIGVISAFDIESRVSNCITKYPNNIKYEITQDGNIILKAGSKVYLYSNGNYEEYILPSDTPASATEQWGWADIVVYEPTENKLHSVRIEDTYTQDTEPTELKSDRCLWDNNKTNEIKWTNNRGTTWKTVSLPILYGNPSMDKIKDTDIMQGWGQGNIKCVFSGIGFIGARTFVLPDLEYLIPNGLNDNGTLKSIKVKTTEVKFLDLSKESSNYCFLATTGILGGWGGSYKETLYSLPFDVTNKYYSKFENLAYKTSNNGKTYERHLYCYAGRLEKNTPGNVTKLELVPPINLKNEEPVNQFPHYNKRNIIQCGHLGNWGGDTLSYTAPDDGFMYIEVRDSQKTAGASCWIDVNGVSFGYCSRWGANAGGPTMLDKVFPVRQGDKIQLVSNWNQIPTTFAYIGHFEFWAIN